MSKITYLGDGVYVSYDGYHVKLMANSHDNPTDTVYLDSQVIQSLVMFLENRLNLKITVERMPNEEAQE